MARWVAFLSASWNWTPMNSWRDLRPLERASLMLLSIALLCVVFIVAAKGCASRADITVTGVPAESVGPEVAADTVIAGKPGRKPKRKKAATKPRLQPIERDHLDEGAGE